MRFSDTLFYFVHFQKEHLPPIIQKNFEKFQYRRFDFAHFPFLGGGAPLLAKCAPPPSEYGNKFGSDPNINKAGRGEKVKRRQPPLYPRFDNGSAAYTTIPSFTFPRVIVFEKRKYNTLHLFSAGSFRLKSLSGNHCYKTYTFFPAGSAKA